MVTQVKQLAARVFVAALIVFPALTANAQLRLGKIASAAQQSVQALTLSDADIAAYVSQAVEQMDKENTLLPDTSSYSRRLAALTEGITEVDGIPLNFKVYQTDDVNAFACPDGSVRVYTGLMDIMDDDELLGVVGHEIGHVRKHHSRNAMRTQLLTGAARDAIASAGGTVARLSEGQLGAIGDALLNTSYSRKQEAEADECGYDFLVANGRNPWGMVMAFEKLQALEQQGAGAPGTVAKMFSSHPDTASRIDKMTRRCIRDGYQRPQTKE